jgi:hypothetical protein
LLHGSGLQVANLMREKIRVINKQVAMSDDSSFKRFSYHFGNRYSASVIQAKLGSNENQNFSLA